MFPKSIGEVFAYGKGITQKTFYKRDYRDAKKAHKTEKN